MNKYLFSVVVIATGCQVAEPELSVEESNLVAEPGDEPIDEPYPGDEPPPPPPPEEEPPPIVGGELSSCYPQVVSIKTSTGHRCTGVVAANNVVLTSAHCITIAALNGWEAASYVEGADNRRGNITDVYIHPEYARCDIDGDFSHRDVAVLKIDNNILPPGIPPAYRATSLPPVGTELQTIGYGLPNRGERRQGQFRFDGLTPEGIFHSTGLTAGICSGDSGAPLFTREPGSCAGNPSPTIFALHASRPSSPCTATGPAYGADITNASNAAFINSAIAGTAARWDGEGLQNCCTDGAMDTCWNAAEQCDGTRVCDSVPNTWGECVCTTITPGGGDTGGGTGGTGGGSTGGGGPMCFDVFASDVCEWGGRGSGSICYDAAWGGWYVEYDHIECLAG